MVVLKHLKVPCGRDAATYEMLMQEKLWRFPLGVRLWRWCGAGGVSNAYLESQLDLDPERRSMHCVFVTIMSKEVALQNHLQVQFEKKTDPLGPCTSWSRSMSTSSSASSSSSCPVHPLSPDDFMFDDEDKAFNGDVHIGTQEDLDTWGLYAESDSDEDDNVVDRVNLKESEMLVSDDSDCDSDVKYEGTHQSAFHGKKMCSEEEHDSDRDVSSSSLSIFG